MAQEDVKRRLLTILAADIAGYSRLVSEDEDHALGQLALLRAAMDPLIDGHGGRIANTAGDSVIAVFESPVEAVRAAIDIQQAHDKHNQEVIQEKQLRYRIGINIGDVSILSNGDILGHGVNVAARLEALARPGGICLAENIYEQIRGKINFSLSKIGEHFVKNIDHPIKVYSVGPVSRFNFADALRVLNNALRRPAAQISLATTVVFILGLTVWLAVNLNEGEEFVPSELQDIVRTEMLPDELLEQFDLVTEGAFGSSRYYIIRTWGGTAEDIQLLAERLSGYVVAINSEDENQYLFDLSMEDAGHWYESRSGDQIIGPTIGLIQTEGADEPGGGWAWSNEEPLGFEAWAPWEPNNWGGDERLAVFSSSRGTQPEPYWNDNSGISRSSIVEIPASNTSIIH